MIANEMDSLQEYIERLDKLRLWKKGEVSKPHKHLLILAIFRVLDGDPNHKNRFTFDELDSIFKDLWEEFQLGIRSDAYLEYPFYHMSTDGFWHFRIRAGAEERFELYKKSTQPRYRFTKARIRETIEYAYLDDELYELILAPTRRQELKAVIASQMSALQIDSSGAEVTTSLFQHEILAIKSIQTGIRKYTLGRVISNLLLYDEGTNDYYECDIIVVGYTGIYLVELKHWSGHIQIASYNWRIDRAKYRRDPHAANTFKAKILKGIYQHQFRTYPADLRVESVVVLTNPEAEVVGATNYNTDKHCPTFDSIENFLDYLRHQHSTRTKLLSSKEIEGIAGYLESLQQPKRECRYSISGYEVVEHLTQKLDLVEVVARPTTRRYRNLSRFRVFFPPIKADPIERERFIKRAGNTLDAVSQIGDHPNVLRVWPVPDESGVLIEGSDWSEEGTLNDWIQNKDRQISQEQALAICSGILKALEAAHGKGVIHRAVKPENVLMVNGQPKLMNFELSYQLASDQNVTVIPDVSVLKRDAYTAPEVFAKEDVDDSTDLFSVGVILYELLVGERPFKSSMDLDRLGGCLTGASMSKLRATGIPEDIIETIERLVRSDRTARPQSAEQVLALLHPTEPARPSELEQVLNRKLEPGASYDLYRIERLIGEGTEAQVYEARTVRNEQVALKIFNRDIPLQRILDEERAAAEVKSSYLAQAKRLAHWNNDRYFIEMNFVDGRLMREDISKGALPCRDCFVHVTSCLLEAIHALHRGTEGERTVPILHGDIKPDNIILRPDGGAVLFDFGCTGPPRVDKYQGTDGYVAPDLISGSDLQFCESGDLFALGVSLFEWLFGKRPYTRTRMGEVPRLPDNLQTAPPKPLLDCLLKAVQTDSGARYANIEEMRAAFSLSLQEAAALEQAMHPRPVVVEEEEKEIVEPVVPLVVEELPGNPFVAYLNSLHNASINNENLAESQAVSPHFGFIHVPLKVTEYILHQLTDDDGSHVILTGHAGDGKSTIGLDLYKRSKDYSIEEPLPNGEWLHSREEIQLGRREIVLIKDMSEIGESDRLEILKDACKQDRHRYLIISNTGTLLNAFEGLAEKSEWFNLQNQLLAALEAGAPTDLFYQDGRFQLINLVRTDNISTACRIFERMLASDRWKPCEDSACREECPIYDNVRMLREHWGTARDRVELAYRRLFEYGSRLTLRQITGHLAYAITAGLGYDDIRRFAEEAKRPPLRHFLFFNRFFGDSGEIPDPSADQIKAVHEMRALEPGRRTHQRLDRLLWLVEDGGDTPLVGDSVRAVYDHLRKAGAGRVDVDRLPPESARMQVRRLLYFFGGFQTKEAERSFVSAFLHSPTVVDFARWQKGVGALTLLERKRLKQGILHVLQEHFTGIRLPENAADQETVFITLNRHNYEIRQSAQIVLAKFQADNFELILEPFDSGIGEIRYEPKLRELTTGKILSLELPFLDYVTNRFFGEIAQKLQSFYADRLEQFKVALLRSKRADAGHNMMLIRLQLNHRFKSQTLNVRDSVLEVI